MHQTAYRPLHSLGKLRTSYIGGFCSWYYTPIENIASFPAVNPQTQKLLAEPVLHAGKSWYGPVNTPSRHTGWEENLERSKPGLFYKQKVAAYIAGLGADSHINLQNLVHHELCIVGKLRSGGHYIIVGDDICGMRIDTSCTSGTGSLETPGSKLVFTKESVYKSYILPSFSGTNIIRPPGSTGGGGTGGTNTTNMSEIIYYNNVSTISVPYTPARRAKFGDFPAIEVWMKGLPENIKVPTPDISVDLEAPNQTEFTINVAGPASGWILLH